MSPSQPPGGPKKPENDGKSKLSSEEIQQLDEIFNLVKKGMPASMAQDVDKFLDKVKRDGVPDELRKAMDETAKEGMSPARAATFWRLTTQMARQTADEVVNERKGSKDEQAKQQTSEDPGPGNNKKDGNKKKKPDELFPGMSGINFDLSQEAVFARVDHGRCFPPLTGPV